MRLLTKVFAALGAVVFVMGCGGGGGSSSTGGSESARVGLFVTDDLSTNYDHVWVTIKKVELSGPGAKVTAYNDPTGKVVDLRALNQGGSQIFAMLGEAHVPAGTYNKAEFTLDEHLVLFPTGATVGLDRTFAGSGAGVKKLEFALLNQTVAGATDIVADFDLSKWNDNGTFVTAVVVAGDDHGIDLHQEDHDFSGTISNLTGAAPNFSFDLTRGEWILHVSISSSTNIFNGSGAGNPTLGTGMRVEVTGTFDTGSRVLNATDIKIEDESGEDAAEIKGAVSAIGSSTFDITTSEVEGFVPSATTVHVSLAAGARFFTDGGITVTQEEFFAALATAGNAEVEGSYDESTNTLTASKLKIEDEHADEAENEAEVQGAISDLDVSAGTFKITITEWEGVMLESGAVLSVTTDGSTEFRGVTLATLANGATLEVKGTLDGSTLKAERVKLED